MRVGWKRRWLLVLNQTQFFEINLHLFYHHLEQKNGTSSVTITVQHEKLENKRQTGCGNFSPQSSLTLSAVHTRLTEFSGNLL